MNLKSSLRPVAMFAVSFVALEAVAQPTADKPDLKVGDNSIRVLGTAQARAKRACRS